MDRINALLLAYYEDATVVDTVVVLDLSSFVLLGYTSGLDLFEFGIRQSDTNDPWPECSDEDGFEQTFIVGIDVPLVKGLIPSRASARWVYETDLPQGRLEILA